MAHHGFEMYRMSLRDTVNEGSDDGSPSGNGALDTSATCGRAQRSESMNGRSSRRGSLVAEPPTQAASTTPPPPPVLLKSNGDKASLRDSGHVVLVTRPSQRDIEQWTERATSTMVRSSGGSVRFSAAPTQQSRRWVLEYKPVVRHSGWLIKRGHSIRNFKRRLFCIIDHELVYHDTHDSTEVRGRIDLRKRTTVQCLLQSGFSLSQGSYQMILYALDQNDRDVWIKSLLEQGVELLPASAKTAKLIEQHSNNVDKNPILFSGWLRKRGQMVKSTKRRWFELSNTTLTYYSHPEGGTKKGAIDVTNARISHVDTLKTGERFSFVVRTPQRELIVHADSQEERSLWVASLSSVADGSHSLSGDGTESFSTLSSSFIHMDDIGSRRCSCNAGSGSSLHEAAGSQLSVDGCCRRCISSFISKTEDALLDVTREVQLILASPYSPEGTTTSAFLKEHQGRPIDNAVLKEFMSGLSDYMAHTRLNELRVLGGRSGGGGGAVSSSSSSPHDGCDDHSGGGDNADTEDATLDDDDTSEFTERILAIIHEQIEERVFFPLYRAVHDNVKQLTRADSKVLRGKIEVLQSKAQSFFGIGPDTLSPSAWESACVQLKEVDKLSLPYMKRSQLVAACKEIYVVYHMEHPSNAPMSADDFIPVFIYVVVQARLSDPVFLKEMVTFFDVTGMQGEAAYFVTCLEIAIEYIRSLVTACTVVLDATQKLGIEFAKSHTRDLIMVNRLVRDGQAEQSHAVQVGSVLVAINGLLVYEMELNEVTKMVTSIDGDIELCLLSLEEYERRFGAAKRAFRGDDYDEMDGGDLDRSGGGDGAADDEDDFKRVASASTASLTTSDAGSVGQL